MNSQDMRVITAVAIMTGTLVIGLEHLSSQPISNLIHLTQGSANLKAPGAGGAEQSFGGPSGAIDARDNSRMDTRQTSGYSDTANASRMGRTTLEQGVTDLDSRRDNSRLDTRQERRAPAATPNTQDQRQ